MNAEAYGIAGEDGSLLACIEICPEERSNRHIVTELWGPRSFARGELIGFDTCCYTNNEIGIEMRTREQALRLIQQINNSDKGSGNTLLLSSQATGK